MSNPIDYRNVTQVLLEKKNYLEDIFNLDINTFDNTMIDCPTRRSTNVSTICPSYPNAQKNDEETDFILKKVQDWINIKT